MKEFTSVQMKDLRILVEFIRVFCKARHSSSFRTALPASLAGSFRKEVLLCPDCQALLEYALQKRRNCPLDPKPSCKKCHIHCYSKQYRSRIREIMAFSGRRMVMRGRLDYLWHYFFNGIRRGSRSHHCIRQWCRYVRY